MIKFQNVAKIYPPDMIALKDVNFEVKPKEFVLLSGKSGAGKTTLFKLLLAEERPTEGRIFFDDQDVSRMKLSKLHNFRRKIHN